MCERDCVHSKENMSPQIHSHAWISAFDPPSDSCWAQWASSEARYRHRRSCPRADPPASGCDFQGRCDHLRLARSDEVFPHKRWCTRSECDETKINIFPFELSQSVGVSNFIMINLETLTIFWKQPSIELKAPSYFWRWQSLYKIAGTKSLT